MVIAIMLSAVAPDVKTQAQRERELEMMFRGDEIAEAIARYYSAGRLSPAGLVVKTPPPPYGFLTELKKLRDGVTIGNEQFYFARASAMIDPLTNEQWEPIRIGDPRLRKFFRAWQQNTGRQLPPIYATYMGGGVTLDTTEHPEGDTNVDGQQNEGNDAGQQDDENLNDEDENDDEDDEEDDSSDQDDSLNLPPAHSGDATFVNASYQFGQPSSDSNSNSNTNTSTSGGSNGATNSNRGWKNPNFTFGHGGSERTGPIIGVISKAKGTSIISRFGITHYEEMIFIYIPPQQVLLPAQNQQVAPGQRGQSQGIDSNGDGVPDDVEPNPKPGEPQQ
jgi:hypothetical protein